MVPWRSEAKCLGYWWKGDLFATCAVDEGISKGKKAFFQFGSIGTFDGEFNPASSRSIIDTCVMLVLLYGCENWILSSHIDKLHRFLCSQVAKVPLQHSSTCRFGFEIGLV